MEEGKKQSILRKTRKDYNENNKIPENSLDKNIQIFMWDINKGNIYNKNKKKKTKINSSKI